MLVRTLRRFATVCIAFAACVTLAPSCKPSPGSSCQRGEARCIDERRELVCQAGKFVESPCNGPDGCRAAGTGTSCDVRGNKPGDPCSTDEDGAAACSNKDALLACHGGRYALVPCRGPRACSSSDGRSFCDNSLAEPGDACREENLKACSVDGAQALVCKQGVMQRFYQCRGAAGCAAQGGTLHCDTSIAMVGDACDQKLEGRAYSCTPDARSILVCRGGAFVLDQSCKSGQKCSASGARTECTAMGQ